MSTDTPVSAGARGIPKFVLELSAAAEAVRDAAQAMSNNKESWRKVLMTANEIQTCVDNTARALHHRGEQTDLPVVVIAALGTSGDMLRECASYMKEAAGEDQLARMLHKGATRDAAVGYLAVFKGLKELLKAHNNECGLIMKPSDGFGQLMNLSSAALTPIIDQAQKGKSKDGITTEPPPIPDIKTAWLKDTLDANITIVDAAYDGLKSTLNVMVNITDGLPWPFKAAPQTLLYILKLLEDYQDVRPKITSLLYSIQQIWDAVENLTKKTQLRSDYLQNRLAGFLEILWRIAIRLRIILSAGWIKRALAIHSINACLDSERQRMQDARDNIMLALQSELLTRADETGVLMKHVHVKMEQLDITGPPAPLVSTMNITTTLPPKPDIFHGRDDFVRDAISLLIEANTARLAVLGAGGMGKTSVALAIMHADNVVRHFANGRLFLSCEALSDADSIIIALAKLLDLKASNDLLTSVVSHLRSSPRTLLVLDNLETVWLVKDVTKVPAVELLLLTLAKISTLSLVITCRGNVLPPRVQWSNAANAALAPFSLEAAMQTFEEISSLKLVGEDKILARQLLGGVDMMPLAVTLLGQLAQRGVTLSDLLERWTRTRNALLRVRSAGREYNIDASIGLTIESLGAATTSPEPLQLLAICSKLPDGLRPPIFEALRGHFDDIHAARQVLNDYALVSINSDGVLRTLSPIRHFTLAQYPLKADHHDALCSIYFALVSRLEGNMDEGFKERVALGIPELGNLATLLLTLVHEPSDQVVQAVVGFTSFMYWIHPTVTVACALLPHLEQHPHWKAQCSEIIGINEIALGDYESGVNSLTTAKRIYQEDGNLPKVAHCVWQAADGLRHLGNTDEAEALLNSVCEMLSQAGNVFAYAEASCRFRLGVLLHDARKYLAAVVQLLGARLIFRNLNRSFAAAQCSEELGSIYLDVNLLESAVVQLEDARSVFISLEAEFHIAKSTCLLATARRRQGSLTVADTLLGEVKTYSEEKCTPYELAKYYEAIAYLRLDQGRLAEGVTYFELAMRNYRVQDSRRSG